MATSVALRGAPRMIPEVVILDAKTIGELPAATGEREAVGRRCVRGRRSTRTCASTRA